MEPWELKAHSIITRLCVASWRAANVRKDGTRRRRHVPYAVPDVARDLVECLATRDEERAKAIFLYSYEAQS